jgi:signal transduction histidine kinase
MDLHFETGDLSGHTLTVDAPTFERILLNLVDNACKYASGSADCRLHIAAAILPGRRPILEVKVRDRGPGIPDRDRRRVFLPFHRSRRDADGPQSGLGLGLALARGLARGLGGDLALGREGPDGAEFRLTLPAQARP